MPYNTDASRKRVSAPCSTCGELVETTQINGTRTLFCDKCHLEAKRLVDRNYYWRNHSRIRSEKNEQARARRLKKSLQIAGI